MLVLVLYLQVRRLGDVLLRWNSPLIKKNQPPANKTKPIFHVFTALLEINVLADGRFF